MTMGGARFGGWAMLAPAAFCAACGADDAPPPFVAVTFNTGTTEGLAHDAAPDDGYTSAHAALSDMHYGDGLAWRPAVEAVARFFDEVQPDIVGFQEIFHSADCATIPAEARADFVCETWTEGDPTVANVVLGAGYHVACHLEKPDKCLAVKNDFGRIEGCDRELCLDGLDGARVPGCGGGSRVGRARVRLTDGTSIDVVNVHGSSGISSDDVDCRKKQLAQVFDDYATGERNVVLGDFNTDPARLFGGDDSATALAQRARGEGFAFLTDRGEDAPPSYAGLFDIDHVLSDFADGSCWVAGVTLGRPLVIEAVYFDHRPVVCSLTAR